MTASAVLDGNHASGNCVGFHFLDHRFNPAEPGFAEIVLIGGSRPAEAAIATPRSSDGCGVRYCGSL